MSTDFDMDLARRLVAHPRWRWAPGMLATGDDTRGEGRVCFCNGLAEYYSGPADIGDEEYPDLTDDATAGVLLGWLLAADKSRAYVIGWSTVDPRGVLGEAVARPLLAMWEEE